MKVVYGNEGNSHLKNNCSSNEHRHLFLFFPIQPFASVPSSTFFYWSAIAIFFSFFCKFQVVVENNQIDAYGESIGGLEFNDI